MLAELDGKEHRRIQRATTKQLHLKEAASNSWCCWAVDRYLSFDSSYLDLDVLHTEDLSRSKLVGNDSLF